MSLWDFFLKPYVEALGGVEIFLGLLLGIIAMGIYLKTNSLESALAFLSVSYMCMGMALGSFGFVLLGLVAVIFAVVLYRSWKGSA